MKKLLTKKELLTLMLSELQGDVKGVGKIVKRRLRRYSELEFIERFEKFSGRRLIRIRKNLYYLN
jgi:hypothetical protein